MAVPSSGQLRLRGDIALEVDGVATGINISLRSLSSAAGLSTPDSMSEFYGYTSAVIPSVTTNAISNLGTTTLRANGNVASDGGAVITERGFYIGTNSSSPTNNTKYTVSGTTGGYLYNVSGLIDNRTYYVWAFATNSVGTTYGGRVQATTVQAFNPTYATAGKTQTDILIGNVNSAIPRDGTFTFYSLHYYINPITGGYVGTYNQNTSSFVPIGQWMPSDSYFTTFYRNSGTYNWVTNAQNEQRAQVNTSIGNWNNYYVVWNFQVQAYPGKYFSNYTYGNTKLGNIGRNESSSRLYYSGNGDAYGSAGYAWSRFNYS